MSSFLTWLAGFTEQEHLQHRPAGKLVAQQSMLSDEFQALDPSADSPDASNAARLSDLLELYAFHASGGSLTYTLRLAQIYYSTKAPYTVPARALVGSEETTKSQESLLCASLAGFGLLKSQIENGQWQEGDQGHCCHGGHADGIRSSGRQKSAARKNDPDEDLTLQEDPIVMVQAGTAAALLGNMYLRGEGVPEDAQRAWFWFWSGAELSDPDCQYGCGLMRSQGLDPDQWRKKDGKLSKKGEDVDMKRAVDMWEKAVKGNGAAGHAGTSAALGDPHLERGDLPSAGVLFAAAVTSGSPFEGFHGLELVNARIYKHSLSVLTP
ncbi:unnamed protein product [Sympodiomycopsis kandeliae]